jgi:hypothetical protein
LWTPFTQCFDFTECYPWSTNNRLRIYADTDPNAGFSLCLLFRNSVRDPRAFCQFLSSLNSQPYWHMVEERKENNHNIVPGYYDTFFSLTLFISLFRAEGSKPAAVQPVQGGGRGGDLLLRLPAARPHIPLTQVNISFSCNKTLVEARF